MNNNYNLESLQKVMETLLSENGCSWDKAQTHLSLKKYLLEETYEVIDAIDNNNYENLKEELGDLLFQIVFHSELAKKENKFDLNSVIDGITKKMINRHPHIFSKNSEKQISWDSIKKEEKGYKNNIDIIKSVPKSLPALLRSEKVISKTSSLQLDTLNIDTIISKNENLSSKLKDINSMNKTEKMEFIGNYLLNLSKISSFLQLNAEFSLTNALEMYINKIEDIEIAKVSDKKKT